jgi:hypothetical protein
MTYFVVTEMNNGTRIHVTPMQDKDEALKCVLARRENDPANAYFHYVEDEDGYLVSTRQPEEGGLPREDYEEEVKLEEAEKGLAEYEEYSRLFDRGQDTGRD